MWCTMLIGFVTLLVAVICNAGELQREMSNSRLDAEQEPFETLTVVDANGPSSTLFNGCLAASRTLEAKLYSIELPDAGVEFIRYVPDSYQLKVLPEWELVTRDPPVSSILECAAATFEAGKPMFKYNGGDDCKVSSRVYDSAYEPACETEEQDAVFISSGALSECPLPFVMRNVDLAAGTYTCIPFTTVLMNFTEAYDWCSLHGGEIFSEKNATAYEEIVQILNDLNLGTNDFFANAVQAEDDNGVIIGWVWPDSEFVNPNLMLTAAGGIGDVMYMKGSADFKFDFAPVESFKAGTVCTSEGPLL